ncbi:hypothetical protein EHS25_008809 [Saitozyma podzolica]|uniref:Palmitoyltransferase n=1 Tax=Saitozyma podzolica TaxID=1890683 RepID=A0A427YMQ6_9TREE|nr:hypothetical protein EHS25_008809 [Saitozyma podzolica]
MADVNSTLPPPQDLDPTHQAPPSGLHDKGDARAGSSPGRWKEKYTPAKPDPWVQRKFAVGILIALVIWSFYVVVGRICAPAIQRQSAASWSRATGAGTMVGYVVLWLLFAWSYLKMLVTGPGFAKEVRSRHALKLMLEVVPKTSAPPVEPLHPFIQYNPPSDSMALPPPPVPPTAMQQPGTMREPARSDHPRDASTSPESDPLGPDPSMLAPITNAVGSALAPHASHQMSSSATLATQRPPTSMSKKGKRGDLESGDQLQRPVPRVEFGPRWCRFCEINKPDRTHHCRHCGTCVMAFDHHCLWVGLCVGWGNHKFFMVFNMWSAFFCLYILVTCIVYTSKSTANTDGQVVALIPVSALFFLFSAMMFGSHVYLVITGKTTVESFRGRDQHEREAEVLQQEFGILWHNFDKRRVRKRWKEEFGGVPVDGRWRFGTAGQMWKQDMGESWWGWIFPVGRPLGDGIHFQSNPHFGPNGEWLRKQDWPKDLQ